MGLNINNSSNNSFMNVDKNKATEASILAGSVIVGEILGAGLGDIRRFSSNYFKNMDIDKFSIQVDPCECKKEEGKSKISDFIASKHNYIEAKQNLENSIDREIREIFGTKSSIEKISFINKITRENFESLDKFHTKKVELSSKSSIQEFRSIINNIIDNINNDNITIPLRKRHKEKNLIEQLNCDAQELSKNQKSYKLKAYKPQNSYKTGILKKFVFDDNQYKNNALQNLQKYIDKQSNTIETLMNFINNDNKDLKKPIEINRNGYIYAKLKENGFVDINGNVRAIKNYDQCCELLNKKDAFDKAQKLIDNTKSIFSKRDILTKKAYRKYLEKNKDFLKEEKKQLKDANESFAAAFKEAKKYLMPHRIISSVVGMLSLGLVASIGIMVYKFINREPIEIPGHIKELPKNIANAFNLKGKESEDSTNDEIIVQQTIIPIENVEK